MLWKVNITNYNFQLATVKQAWKYIVFQLFLCYFIVQISESEDRSMSQNGSKLHFKIAISFSGDNIKIVKDFCNELLKIGFTKSDIFFYPWHNDIITGITNADEILRDIYHNNCELDVVLLSHEYQERNWTNNVEWKAITALLNEGQEEKVYLLSYGEIDWTKLSQSGIYYNKAITAAIDKATPSEIAELINKRYKTVTGSDNLPFREKFDSFIYDETNNFINGMRSLTVKFPQDGNIINLNVLNQLKRTPREGKRLRLENTEEIKEKIQPRTVYDHMISLAYLASVIGMIIPRKAIPLVQQDIAKLIAYHEIPEAIIGDIPSYTNFTSNIIPNKIEKNKQEYYVNRFISLYADDKQFQCIGYLCNRLVPANGKDKRLLSSQMDYFKALDRLDCIVAIWRYIPYYRTKCSEKELTIFVDAMSDFFTNERLRTDPVLSTNTILHTFVSFVSNKQYALEYARGATLAQIFEKESLDFSQNLKEALTYLIEEVPLFITDDTAEEQITSNLLK